MSSCAASDKNIGKLVRKIFMNHIDIFSVCLPNAGGKKNGLGIKMFSEKSRLE